MKNAMVIVVLLIWNTALFSQQTGTFTDQRNGKTYKTVAIGSQTILAENFAYKPESGNCQSFENSADN
ncbi:MAG TPA: hypothetical protein DCQ31_14370, partial [Bacteroidales bacterium]|nr:hypothetical protein [Bacteroidales bacterium]